MHVKLELCQMQYRIPCNPLSILKQSISLKGGNFFRHAYFCQRAYFGLCEDLALKHEESADLEERGTASNAISGTAKLAMLKFSVEMRYINYEFLVKVIQYHNLVHVFKCQIFC